MSLHPHQIGGEEPLGNSVSKADPHFARAYTLLNLYKVEITRLEGTLKHYTEGDPAKDRLRELVKKAKELVPQITAHIELSAQELGVPS